MLMDSTTRLCIQPLTTSEFVCTQQQTDHCYIELFAYAICNFAYVDVYKRNYLENELKNCALILKLFSFYIFSICYSTVSNVQLQTYRIYFANVSCEQSVLCTNETGLRGNKIQLPAII